ncbi:hypothetical protein VTL71DRAFT_15246 [Oculimacula yallundae]|uniref:Uncharacterized protein n=1 Tax=Oculimacula yallundae TaxID=86028 RepID=A0ABR4CG54_9HELO
MYNHHSFFLDPFVIHQQASTQDLSIFRISLFSQAQSDRPEGLGNNRIQHFRGNIIYKGRNTKVARAALSIHRIFIICIWSTTLQSSADNIDYVKTLPLIRLSFVINHFNSDRSNHHSGKLRDGLNRFPRCSEDSCAA